MQFAVASKGSRGVPFVLRLCNNSVGLALSTGMRACLAGTPHPYAAGAPYACAPLALHRVSQVLRLSTVCVAHRVSSDMRSRSRQSEYGTEFWPP